MPIINEHSCCATKNPFRSPQISLRVKSKGKKFESDHYLTMGNNRILKSLAVLLGSGLVLTDAASPAPEVEIANGTIRGGRCASAPVNYFLSIPYAVAPVGDLRFTPPQPYNQTFAGVRDATTPAPSCPQLGIFFVAYQAGQSEDWYVSC